MIPANIWSKSQIQNIKGNKNFNPDIIPDELRLPAGVKDAKPIADIDVTFADIKSLGEKHSLYPIIEFLRASWVGDNKERETNCRIGTMYVYFDKDGAMHMNFISRTNFPKETQTKILKAFNQYWGKISNF